MFQCLSAHIFKGEYSGQKSLFFPHPQIPATLILPCFSRYFWRGNAHAGGQSTQNKENMKEMARSAEIFVISALKLLKMTENCQKIVKNATNLEIFLWGRAYFFPVFFWRIRPEY